MHWFTITDNTVSEHFQMTQEVLLTPTIFFMKSPDSRRTFLLSRLRTIHTCTRIFFHSLTAPSFNSNWCGSGRCANNTVWLEVIDNWLGLENEIDLRSRSEERTGADGEHGHGTGLESLCGNHPPTVSNSSHHQIQREWKLQWRRQGSWIPILRAQQSFVCSHNWTSLEYLLSLIGLFIPLG